jgi:hypothetical protein
MSHFDTGIAGYVIYSNIFNLTYFRQKVKGFYRGVGGSLGPFELLGHGVHKQL